MTPTMPKPEMTSPRLLIFVAHYPPAFLGGGPARTIQAMVRHSLRASEVRIITSDTDHGAGQPLDVPHNAWTARDGTKVWYASTNKIQTLAKTFQAAAHLRPDYIYINSLFNPVFSILPLTLRRVGYWNDAQVVLAPRGELDPGALALKSWKKQLFIRLASNAGLFRGITWHASGELEATHLKRLGLTGEVLVKENETLLPPQASIPTRAHSRHIELLYVGRISPKKQLELLLGALLRTKGDFTLHIVGGSADAEYQRTLQALAEPLGEKIVWHGAMQW